MDEQATAELNALLLGEEPTAPKAQQPDETESEDVDDSEDEETTEETSEEDDSSDEEEEESDADDESEDDEPKKRGTPDAKYALQREREQRRSERVAHEAYKAEMAKLLADPDFLAHQYQKLQEEKANPKPQEPAPAEIPDAPFYPNTPRGIERMQSDQEAATARLGEYATNRTVLLAIEGIVSRKTVSYLEATKEVMDLMGLKASQFKKEGKSEADAVAAKKSRMSTETKPRTGAATKAQNVQKRMNSANRTVRERAIADSLGLI